MNGSDLQSGPVLLGEVVDTGRTGILQMNTSGSVRAVLSQEYEDHLIGRIRQEITIDGIIVIVIGLILAHFFRRKA